LHAAGKLVRIGFFKPPEPDQRDVALNGRGNFLTRLASELQAIGDVFFQPLPRKQTEVLENHGDIGPRLSDKIAVDEHIAAVADDQAIDNSQQSRLAAAAGPQNTEVLIGRDLKIDILQRHHRSAAVSLGEIPDDDLGHGEIKFQGFPGVS